MTVHEKLSAAIAEMREAGREVTNTTEELILAIAEELGLLKGEQPPAPPPQAENQSQ